MLGITFLATNVKKQDSHGKDAGAVKVKENNNAKRSRDLADRKRSIEYSQSDYHFCFGTSDGLDINPPSDSQRCKYLLILSYTTDYGD